MSMASRSDSVRQSRASSCNKPIFKIILLGAPSVGKTSIINKFVKGTFSDDNDPSVNVKEQQKDVNVTDEDGNDLGSARFIIWDTAGQELFDSISIGYYRNADAALLVYDVTCENSFNKTIHWTEEL